MRRAVPAAMDSTLGRQSSPSRVNYRFKGRPGWPLDPETRDDRGGVEKAKGGALARKADRERRLAEFTAARAEEPPLSVIAAGERVGVTRKTANRYEKDRLAALEAADA